MASRSVARADRIHPRAWLRIGHLALALIVCLIPHALLRLLRQRSPWPRRFLHWAGFAAGTDVEVSGTPVTRDVLFIANHVSWLDILTLAGRTGCSFIAKSEMAPWPLIGWLATLNDSVYVERDNRLGAHGQAKAVRRALATGKPLTLFAEGTTNDTHSLLPFRSSLLAAVVPAPDGITIQPVAIDYGGIGYDIAWVGDEAFAANALRVLSRRGRFVTRLHFLDPLDHRDFDDRKAIAAHSRAAIAARLGLG